MPMCTMFGCVPMSEVIMPFLCLGCLPIVFPSDILSFSGLCVAVLTKYNSEYNLIIMDHVGLPALMYLFCRLDFMVIRIRVMIFTYCVLVPFCRHVVTILGCCLEICVYLVLLQAYCDDNVTYSTPPCQQDGEIPPGDFPSASVGGDWQKLLNASFWGKRSMTNDFAQVGLALVCLLTVDSIYYHLLFSPASTLSVRTHPAF